MTRSRLPRRYSKTPIYLGAAALIVAFLGLVAMFIGAYIHDVHHTLSHDQVFIAPFACIAISIVLLVLAAHWETHRDR